MGNAVRWTLVLAAMFGSSACLTAQQDAQVSSPLGLHAAHPVASDIAVANYDSDNGYLSWDPVVGYESIALVVDGPGDWLETHEFSAGTLPFLRAYGADGSPLPDGGYDWELTLTPLMDPQIKAALAEARANGADQVPPELLVAQGPKRNEFVQSGHFHVHQGLLVVPGLVELPPQSPQRTGSGAAPTSGTQGSTPGSGGGPTEDPGDQVILDDLIVDGSLCAGQDCVNGESFGFDTVRLKENNLRIGAVDTSSSASFPSNDWQITFNDSSNGGANKFSIDDITGGKTPFTIEASAPSHSLFVDDGGRIGFGTSTPVVELHLKDGDTPTLRLEQDGSSGFTPQTWDVAGNETNFFIRDATNGSTLPFKVFPGAPSNALTVEGTGDVGVGTTSPDATLDVESSASFVSMRLTASGASPNTAADMTFTDGGDSGSYRINIQDGDNQELELDHNGNMILKSSQSFINLRLQADGASPNNGANLTFTDGGASGSFRINIDGGDNQELALDHDGNLVIDGSLTTASQTLPDYVFKPDYKLLSLSELAEFIQREQHLPRVPSDADVQAAGSINMSEMQLALLEKVEELTLYTLSQQSELDGLRDENAQLVTRLEALEQALSASTK